MDVDLQYLLEMLELYYYIFVMEYYLGYNHYYIQDQCHYTLIKFYVIIFIILMNVSIYFIVIYLIVADIFSIYLNASKDNEIGLPFLQFIAKDTIIELLQSSLSDNGFIISCPQARCWTCNRISNSITTFISTNLFLFERNLVKKKGIFNEKWKKFNHHLAYFQAVEEFDNINISRLYLEASNLIVYDLTSKSQVSNKFDCNLFYRHCLILDTFNDDELEDLDKHVPADLPLDISLVSSYMPTLYIIFIIHI